MINDNLKGYKNLHEHFDAWLVIAVEREKEARNERGDRGERREGQREGEGQREAEERESESDNEELFFGNMGEGKKKEVKEREGKREQWERKKKTRYVISLFCHCYFHVLHVIVSFPGLNPFLWRLDLLYDPYAVIY
jgi:hypothetical protein